MARHSLARRDGYGRQRDGPPTSSTAANSPQPGSTNAAPCGSGTHTVRLSASARRISSTSRLAQAAASVGQVRASWTSGWIRSRLAATRVANSTPPSSAVVSSNRLISNRPRSALTARVVIRLVPARIRPARKAVSRKVFLVAKPMPSGSVTVISPALGRSRPRVLTNQVATCAGRAAGRTTTQLTGSPVVGSTAVTSQLSSPTGFGSRV